MYCKNATDLILELVRINRQLSRLELSKDLNFVGAPDFYVIEKLNKIKSTSNFYIDTIKRISIEQKYKELLK
jgi:hypothetical protein